MPFSKTTQDTTFAVLINIVLAVLIFLNAEAGKMVGIQTLKLHFSAVWPATGFALAALLLFGFRLWPGVFVGNFIYNFLHLYSGASFFLSPLIAALLITVGSLLQALVGAYILRKAMSNGYFVTMKDVVYFLFFGGALTCIIASTLGVVTLYLFEGLAVDDIAFTWLTFWIGDTMGVYIFTPLLVVWTVQKPEKGVWYFCMERLAMILVFAILTYYTVFGYPIGYLYIPYAIWVTYRLNFHGATLVLALIAFAIILPIATGAGPFIQNFGKEMLLIIVSFLEIIASTTLLFAALVNERNAAWQLIKKHRLDLIG